MLKDYWKVPFREVYCDTFGAWVRETVWCHIVLRLFRADVEALLPRGDTLPR